MQVGETVTALTIEAVQTFIVRAMSAGAPRDTVIKVSTKQHGHGFLLSADFEPQPQGAILGWKTTPPAGLSGGMPASAAESWVRDETRPFDSERDADASAVPA